jgi:hypothetical protein
MMAAGALLAATLWLQASAATPPQPFGLTREQALTLPLREVASIVLGQAGGRVREMSRPVYQGIPYPDERLKFLMFAFPPEPGEGALCTATVVYVRFESDAPAAEPAASGRGIPVRVSSIQTYTVHKVVGETAGESPGDELARRRERCSREGPVIPPDAVAFRQPTFFSFSGSLRPRQAVAVLQRLLDLSIAGSHPQLSCRRLTPTRASCADAIEELRQLSLSDLIDLHIVRDDAQPAMHRLVATFDSPAVDRAEVVYFEALVELGDVGPIGHPAPTIVHLGPATVERTVVMVD